MGRACQTARLGTKAFMSTGPTPITAQNLIEFWAVATRPVVANGLGWATDWALAELCSIRDKFPLLPDSPAILEEWIDLIEKSAVSGKRTHDARLVAVMRCNAIVHLLTFNVRDFDAFAGISVIDPRVVA